MVLNATWDHLEGYLELLWHPKLPTIMVGAATWAYDNRKSAQSDSQYYILVLNITLGYWRYLRLPLATGNPQDSDSPCTWGYLGLPEATGCQATGNPDEPDSQCCLGRLGATWDYLWQPRLLTILVVNSTCGHGGLPGTTSGNLDNPDSQCCLGLSMLPGATGTTTGYLWQPETLTTLVIKATWGYLGLHGFTPGSLKSCPCNWKS